MNKRLIIILLLMLTSFSSMRAQENDSAPQQNLFLICSADSLPTKNGYFTVIPSLGLFLMDGQIGYAIDNLHCPDFKKMFISKRANYEKIIFSDDKILVKCEDQLCNLTDSALNAVAVFPDEDFNIFPGHDNTVEIVSYTDDKSRCYTYDLTTNEMTPNVQIDGNVFEMVPVGNGHIIATEHSLYFANDKECEQLFTIDTEIVGVALASFGFYFATTNSLYAYDAATGDVYHKLSSDFLTILGDGSTVYLILKDGDVYALEH